MMFAKYQMVNKQEIELNKVENKFECQSIDLNHLESVWWLFRWFQSHLTKVLFDIHWLVCKWIQFDCVESSLNYNYENQSTKMV